MNHNQNKFCKTFRIGSVDTDLNGKVKLTSICNYLQEIAGMHADALNWGIDQLMEQDLSWVLSRLKVKILSYPHWKEEIKIETWPTGFEGLFGNRDFKITNQKGETIMLASSSWLIVNIKSKRPMRPNNVIPNQDFSNNGKLFDEPLSKIHCKTTDTPASQIQVQYSDIDINQHVNNVKYIKWILDSCPFEQLDSEFIEEFEINFLHEAKYKDQLNVYNYCENDQFYQFEITNKDKAVEHCKAHIKWKN